MSNGPQKEGVLFIKDIIKEAAEETGRPEKEVNEIWSLHVKYLKSLMDREDIYIIKLPKIGNLYFSRFLFRLFNFASKKNKYIHLQEKADRLNEMVEESKGNERTTKFKYPQRTRPSFLKLYKAIQRVVFGKRKRYTSFDKLIEFIENNNNDIKGNT